LVETKENEFVIEYYQKTSWNVTVPFQTIARRAGLGTVVRPYDNMRMSRSNEVERKFGSKKESLWIGHSEKVMMKHYLVMDDEDYAEAVGASVENQIFHAQSHAVSTDSDGLGQPRTDVPLDEHIDLKPCFLARVGIYSGKRHARKNDAIFGGVPPYTCGSLNRTKNCDLLLDPFLHVDLQRTEHLFVPLDGRL